MNLFDEIRGFFVATEHDVIAVIEAIKKDIPVIESDIAAALRWVARQTPTIAADLQTTEALVTAVGAAGNPNVAAAIAAANIAVAGLNAFAASYNSGKPSAEAVVQGYVALKNASSAASAAASAAASTAKA